MVITPSFQVGDGGSIPLICSNSSTRTANVGLSKIQFRLRGVECLRLLSFGVTVAQLFLVQFV